MIQLRTVPGRLLLYTAVGGALVGVCPTPSSAQAPPAKYWQSQLEFGLNGASGNSSFTILRGGFTATRVKTDEYELDFRTLVRYGKNEEKVIADDARASIKFDWRPQERFSPFIFIDAARDRIRRLDFQADGGGGVKWTVTEDERTELSLSWAGIFDYQNFDLPEGSVEDGSEFLGRSSFRLKGERKIGERAAFEHVSFYQPAFSDMGDYVVEVTNSLSSTVLGNLSMVLEHAYLRDSRPPPGAEPDDQKYSVIFRLAF